MTQDNGNEKLWYHRKLQSGMWLHPRLFVFVHFHLVHKIFKICQNVNPKIGQKKLGGSFKIILNNPEEIWKRETKRIHRFRRGNIHDQFANSFQSIKKKDYLIPTQRMQ